MKHKIFILLISLFFIPFTAFSGEWTQMASPNSGYRCVWGSSGTDVFAGGAGGPIAYYNGNSWSVMSADLTLISGIWGSSGIDVYAVGVQGHCGAKSHYNGVNWSTTPTEETYIAYSGIWGSAASDIWVTGTAYNMGSGYYISFMEHYNGTSWSQSGFYYNKHLYGVWGSSASDVFIVGDSGLITHYNGSNWSSMTSGTANTLNGIWGSSGSDVFAVGDSGTILHYGEPQTFIALSSFTVTPSHKEVTISWSTESEIDNAGFNIYRAESEDGEYIKINAALIPAQGSPTQDAAYSFTDENVKNRKTYFYKLEDVDLNGTATSHGPVSATPRLLHGLSNQ